MYRGVHGRAAENAVRILRFGGVLVLRILLLLVFSACGLAQQSQPTTDQPIRDLPLGMTPKQRAESRQRLLEQMSIEINRPLRDTQWRMVGPYRGGRTVAISGVPSQPNLFYMAAVNGGGWRT